ncbi:MAG: hypothetical protein U0271_37395 [Polyangiaceae bacterium]
MLGFAASSFACGDDTTGLGGTGGSGGAGGGGAGGEPAALVPEAGFIEVGPNGVGPNWTGRMFYSFRPADEDPAHKPLMLFFNGGPGSATTGTLMVYHTGPYTLDADGPVDFEPVLNDESYTRFANLLYIDERMAGFSYGLQDTMGNPECVDDTAMYLADAGDYVFALLQFLDSHPALTSAPVTVVGESYGGTRAPLMLHMLQHYAVAPDPPIPELADVDTRVPWLRDRVQAHFDLLDGEAAGAPRTPDEVAVQFGRMVLIQPSFAGPFQLMFQKDYMAADPDFAAFLADQTAYDPYDVREPPTYSSDLTYRSAAALLDPARLALLLGVEPVDVVGLQASERNHPYRHLEGYDRDFLVQSESQLRAALGELESDDSYWLPLASACIGLVGDTAVANAFIKLFERTRVFITNARWDATIYTEAFPALFGLAGFTAEIDTTLPVGADRPGVLRLTSQTDGTVYELRFPTYEAGHMVTTSSGAELGRDVEAWLADNP